MKDNYYDYEVISKYSLTKLQDLLAKSKKTHKRLTKKAEEHEGSNYIPTTRQYEALKLLNDKKTSLVGFGGGAGGGKTILGVFWVISQALTYKETRWFIGRKTLVSLKQTTLLSFFDMMKLLEIPEKQYKYNAQESELTFINGSKVFFKDMDWKPSDPHYTRFGGLELTGAFLDEANEIPEKAIEIIRSRVGRKMNDEYDIHPTLLFTFNPDKAYVYRTFYEPWKKKTERHNVKYVPALAVDNPHIAMSYIESLWNLEDTTKQRLLFGNFDYDDSDDMLVDYQQIIAMFMNVPYEVDGKYIVVDVAGGGKDNSVFSVWRGDELYILEIKNGMTQPEIIQHIRTLAQDNDVTNGNILIDSIGIGEGIAQSPLLAGCVPFKSSNSAIITHEEPKATHDIYGSLKVENKFVSTGYNNMRSQMGWVLADKLKKGHLAVRVDEKKLISIGDRELTLRDVIEEELSMLRDAEPDKDDMKKKLISKKVIKDLIGRSPDVMDIFLMRMYFEVVKKHEIVYNKKTKPIIERRFWKKHHKKRFR